MTIMWIEGTYLTAVNVQVRVKLVRVMDELLLASCGILVDHYLLKNVHPLPGVLNIGGC